jgi:hypothetical protein
MISELMGRILSAVGAVILVMALFLTWYHIDRDVTQGTVDSTGWQTFTRLRLIILGGAMLLLISAVVRQTRAVLVGRTVLGLLLALLILRRIVDPPDLAFAVSSQAGVFAGLIGARWRSGGHLRESWDPDPHRHPAVPKLRRALPTAAERRTRSSSRPPRRSEALPSHAARRLPRCRAP